MKVKGVGGRFLGACKNPILANGGASLLGACESGDSLAVLLLGNEVSGFLQGEDN